ncbi:hypothetical protein [Hyphobacterium marinum]|uniref:Uncharacterized protein n=1 Tax=Hyphobacterium marinum TaxID=3116574 RepID=A0ABU7LZV3_9PROT|nr:hypothetical protein [Hyphobacterium sp. Y6023]MEE2567102.1 hypothetical protein [Hyphobacterium sp. Y6023]
MLWLIWQMWLLLFLAFGIGIAAGWRIWSGGTGGDRRALVSAQEEVSRLRRQNDDLSRSLAAARKDDDETVEPEPETETPVPHNDLLVIRGLGPKAAAALREGGVTSFEQIAAWTGDDVAEWDEKLNARGRITRDDWVGQAKALIDEG